MVLRLILMGLVVGLGVDLPAQRDLDDWSSSGQNWLYAQLDQWNAWLMPGEVGCVADSAVLPEDRAEGSVADSEFSTMVEEMVAACSAERAAADSLAMATDTEADANEAGRTEPDEALAAVGSETESDDSAFDAVVEEMVAAFSDSAEAAEETGEIVALGAADDAGTIEASESFEPVEVGDDLYPGLAYALNREAEGPLSPSTPQVLAPRPAPVEEPEREAAGPSSGQRLATAVRLTGEALQAWATLLQGPAVVSLRP